MCEGCSKSAGPAMCTALNDAQENAIHRYLFKIVLGVAFIIIAFMGGASTLFYFLVTTHAENIARKEVNATLDDQRRLLNDMTKKWATMESKLDQISEIAAAKSKEVTNATAQLRDEVEHAQGEVDHLMNLASGEVEKIATELSKQKTFRDVIDAALQRIRAGGDVHAEKFSADGSVTSKSVDTSTLVAARADIKVLKNWRVGYTEVRKMIVWKETAQSGWIQCAGPGIKPQPVSIASVPENARLVAAWWTPVDNLQNVSTSFNLIAVTIPDPSKKDLSIDLRSNEIQSPGHAEIKFHALYLF